MKTSIILPESLELSDSVLIGPSMMKKRMTYGFIIGDTYYDKTNGHSSGTRPYLDIEVEFLKLNSHLTWVPRNKWSDLIIQLWEQYDKENLVAV